MAADSLRDLTLCPTCGCPAATHYNDPRTRALLCPPEGTDPVKMAEMVARAPKMPTPSAMDLIAAAAQSTDFSARDTVADYRRRRRAEDRRTAAAKARLDQAADFAGSAGLGLPPPFATRTGEPPQTQKPAPRRRRFSLDED